MLSKVLNYKKYLLDDKLIDLSNNYCQIYKCI